MVRNVILLHFRELTHRSFGRKSMESRGGRCAIFVVMRPHIATGCSPCRIPRHASATAYPALAPSRASLRPPEGVLAPSRPSQSSTQRLQRRVVKLGRSWPGPRVAPGQAPWPVGVLWCVGCAATFFLRPEGRCLACWSRAGSAWGWQAGVQAEWAVASDHQREATVRADRSAGVLHHSRIRVQPWESRARTADEN